MKTPAILPHVVMIASMTVALPAQAGVKLPRMFSHHMVLQREMAVPVWGTADPGETVDIEFRGLRKSTVADAKGNWEIRLDALAPGGPDTLKVGQITLNDVLVGDVWLGSGQSNMEMSVTSFTKGDPVLAANAQKSYPKLRLLKGQGTATWTEADPKNLAGFSAMMFSFGMPLQKELDIPVGLMVVAVGGTSSGCWLSESAYRSDPACKEILKGLNVTRAAEERAVRHAENLRKYEEALAKWPAMVEVAKTEGKPAPPAPIKPKPGLIWGECPVVIGELYERHVRPLNGYGIKGVLWDQGESQTGIIGIDQYTLMGALIRSWRSDWKQGDFPFLYLQKPSGGGTAWDPADPVTRQCEPFAALPATVPQSNKNPYNHATHLRIMTYPKTYMVTTTDLGPGTHPTNKSGYGMRAARTALGAVYGRDIEYYGPLYASHQVKADKISVRFTHIGKGLAVKPGGILQGFAIAGDDKKFFWADARIVGDEVILSSKEVPAPKAARYAWNGVFPWANLFNKDGLPAQPFRTDSW